MGASVHPSLTGANALCENDEPVSPSSSEASSDTDADPEEQELAMELGEPAPAVERGTDPEPPTQGHGQAGHRQRRCHTALDLTRSQKVRGTGVQTPPRDHFFGEGGSQHGWGRAPGDAPVRDARALPCRGESRGVGRRFWGMPTAVCLSCRCGRSCCRPPSRVPRQSCPLPPGQVSSPLSPQKPRAGAGQDPPHTHHTGVRDGMSVMEGPLLRRERPVAGQRGAAGAGGAAEPGLQRVGLDRAGQALGALQLGGDLQGHPLAQRQPPAQL